MKDNIIDQLKRQKVYKERERRVFIKGASLDTKAELLKLSISAGLKTIHHYASTRCRGFMWTSVVNIN